MPSRFLRVASCLIGTASFAFLSCEKHHVGELPEVQRERGVAEHAAGGEHHAAKKSETSELSAPAPESASPAGTPVDFFPEKKPQ